MKSNKSSLDHAEMLALRLAMSRMGKERLIGCSMITTLEP
jgi:tRNA(Arg) A34 adenosine deaminase TadA